tara:strand:+ start:1308 stop:2438 length:1131 start_codon:yes stop_codon:yes gene_type:complete
MKIFYWAPWIGKVGTIKAVINSADILEKYSKNSIKTKIIDAVGEWKMYEKKNRYISLSRIKFHKYLPKRGFFNSRLSYLIIFFFSFIPLLNLIKKEKPDFLIAQLITSLPIFLNYIFKFETKVILRISGYPKMNFFRTLFWKIASKKIYKITFPTKSLYEQFKVLKIFDEKKMYILNDPIINYNEIIKLKNDNNVPKYVVSQNYIICIGRLTRQKNFPFLIKNFALMKKKYKDYRLIIIGDGELKNKLISQIKKLNLHEDVILIGHQRNIYKFLKHAKVFVLSSLWEEVGFVMVEAASCNVNIISSDCKNGPEEFLVNGKGGFLFKNNNSESLNKAFDKFINSSEEELFQKRLVAKKQVKKFTFFPHFQNFIKVLK